MTYRAKVYGPSTSEVFGCDVHEVASPADVKTVDGILVVIKPPFDGRPAMVDSSGRRSPARKATRGSQVCYPVGGWTKVIVTDYIEED